MSEFRSHPTVTSQSRRDDDVVAAVDDERRLIDSRRGCRTCWVRRLPTPGRPLNAATVASETGTSRPSRRGRIGMVERNRASSRERV